MEKRNYSRNCVFETNFNTKNITFGEEDFRTLPDS